MKKLKFLSFALVLFLPVCVVLAQNPSDSPAPPPQRAIRHEGCWQQAGVSRAIARQGREIELNTRSQIASVCNDSSLSQQQKRQQAHQLNEQAREQIRGLLTEQQAQAFLACREARGGHMGAGRGAGPCGQFAPAPPSNGNPPSSEQAPPPQ